MPGHLPASGRELRPAGPARTDARLPANKRRSSFGRTERGADDRPDPTSGQRRSHQQHFAQRRPCRALQLDPRAQRSRRGAGPDQRPHAGRVRRPGPVRHRQGDGRLQAVRCRRAGADRARSARRGRDRGSDAARRTRRGDAHESAAAASGRGARARSASPRPDTRSHDQLGDRVPRSVEIVHGRLGRCNRARAGRHRRRCESCVARSVRFAGRGRDPRHAADGCVRRRSARRDQGRAGRLLAGQVVEPLAARECAAVGRLEPAAGNRAVAGRLRRRACRAPVCRFDEARRRHDQRTTHRRTGARRRHRGAAAPLLRATTPASVVATDQGRHSSAGRDPARQARRPDRGRRSARHRGGHRPVRGADRRDAPGQRPVRPLRRRHVRAADGARHAARRRDVGGQSHQEGRRTGVPRRRQADCLHVQRRHRHDRHPYAGCRPLGQRCARRTPQC